MSFSYEQLAESDVRLVTVILDQGEPFLKLSTYPRLSAPEYDALSYCWGDDESVTVIVCNELPLTIRTSLIKALPTIHDFTPEPRRPLWIDAICLDQANKVEKDLHVPLMNEIYEQAARTIVWLGEAADDSDLAISNIPSFTKKLLSVKDPKTLTIAQRLANYGLPPLEHPQWKAIRVLQLRPWFYRLWTLQEIVLSRSPILLCGHRSVSWDALTALHQAAMQASLNGLVSEEDEPKTPYQIALLFVSRVNFLRKSRVNGLHSFLSVLLTVSMDRGYSVSVDRVWALLGLLNKRYRRMIWDARLIDYSDAAVLQYHETFIGVMRFHIEHSTSEAMRLIEQSLPSIRHQKLPSWCPDWHTDKGGFSLALMPEARAGTPGGHDRVIKPFMQVNPDSSLELCGLTVDMIEQVTTSACEDDLNLEGYSWLLCCIDICKSLVNLPNFDVYPKELQFPEVPAIWPGGEKMPEDVHKLERARSIIRYLLYPAGVLNDQAITALRCNGRKFFSTKAGRIGIGPADLKQGDLLCVMYGARTVWALRPYLPLESWEGQYDGISGPDGEYELVGFAYTPSLVKGQAWAGTSCESMQRFKLR